jgi:hypothetical protein
MKATLKETGCPPKARCFCRFRAAWPSQRNKEVFFRLFQNAIET